MYNANKENLALENFDLRSKYNLHKVLDQGYCENCWSLSITSCFSDIILIASRGSLNVAFDVSSFAKENKVGKGDECYGGSMSISTMKNFKMNGCLTKRGERYYPKDVVMISGEESIKSYILSTGPVIALMKLYYTNDNRDLNNFSEGIYGKEFLKNPNIQGIDKTSHFVTIVGWGKLGSDKYWIIRNTWGPNFADHGYFKILRGIGMCGIESQAFAIIV